MANYLSKDEFENLASRLESNIIHSFRLAKQDILDLQDHFLNLSQSQKLIVEMIKELREHEIQIHAAIQNLYKKDQIKHVENSDSKYLLTELKESEKRISQLINSASKEKILIKEVASAPIIHIVASKTSTKFHTSNCPYAHNIKPKNLIRFKDKTDAKNKGFKACSCLTEN
ncbi:hypothetical protein JXM83_04215 [Candidatus Woesearchaeota archaeon]|nr:hypothetical protein [Candidatus Woesearchaeota archaeon]